MVGDKVRQCTLRSVLRKQVCDRTFDENYFNMSACLYLICFVLVLVNADIYLHNPRGSNNRLDERRRPRTNANRMFNSENNNRGGYNVGSLYYYQGSRLGIEWTTQHSCADANSHCELVLQYMCSDHIRDGATTGTIPENLAQCEDNNCNTDRRFGMHEDYNYYLECRLRQRNKGLFTADQDRNRQTARNTRQNAAGTRYGYECPEEHDYYPYWHPTPWKDIAVMTNNVKRCQYYQTESENVKSRWACVIPHAVLEENKGKGLIIPNNKEECQKFRWPKNDNNGVRGEWKEFPSHGLPAPDCRETEFTRDNHLGNGLGGHPNLYNWTVPNLDHEKCILRMRYNVSTNDYDGWSANSDLNALKRNTASKVNLADKYGFESQDTAQSRGYVFKNNPQVKLFGDADFSLRLAINTAQFGRTFEDRSHSFAIRPRPADLEGQTIHNLNVRGKRGNIVQVYPGVEYDFVPNTLEAGIGDYVHIQWTGSNTNPANNDGQGLAGTDRNNIVLLAAQKYPEGNGVAYGPGERFGHFGVNYPMHLSNTTFLGLSNRSMETLAFSDPGQFRGEMSELDDAGTYFDLGPRKITQTGTYHYMCTRNNNFSNRDQKARVSVYPYQVQYYAVGYMGGSVSTSDGNAQMIVDEGVFASLQKLKLEVWSKTEGENKLKAAKSTLSVGDDYASDFFVISPQSSLTTDGKTFTFEMKVDDSGSNVDVYRSNSDTFATWTKVDGDISGGVARLRLDRGGVFVARSQSNVALIVGVTIACIVLVAVVIGGVLYFRRHPSKWQAIGTKCRKAERSLQQEL
ncbi:protein DD3-3-like [Gigantopelta aegis]|uniref:protein DD3-3-like n=1 Tax=Gigantopelta aegis TaxID=1735272 RepID=UPI001B88E6F8|nr:protein DD3-3-like [Gigantopelta aegis]